MDRKNIGHIQIDRRVQAGGSLNKSRYATGRDAVPLHPAPHLGLPAAQQLRSGSLPTEALDQSLNDVDIAHCGKTNTAKIRKLSIAICGSNARKMARPKKGAEKPRSERPDWALRIVEAREAKGWDQGKLGSEVGRSQTAISDYERGRSEPDIATFHRLAENLGVNVAWLILGQGAREPQEGDAAAQAIAERQKENRHFGRALIGTARMFIEEGFDPDALVLVRIAGRIARSAEGASDQLQAREQIDRAIEAERLEWREGLEALTKNRM